MRVIGNNYFNYCIFLRINRPNLVQFKRVLCVVDWGLRHLLPPYVYATGCCG